jgi:hypothetical protein
VGTLRELEGVGAIPTRPEPEGGGLPAELIAAEYTVLTEIPAARDAAQRERLLELARMSLADVRRDASAGGGASAELEAHGTILDFLIRLSAAELAAEEGKDPETSPGELFEEFIELALRTQIEDARLIEQVQSRLRESPVNPYRAEPAPAALGSGVAMIADEEHGEDASGALVAEVLGRELPGGLERLALSEVESLDWRPVRLHYRVYVLLHRTSRDERWMHALNVMRAAKDVGIWVVVFADRFEPGLANQVQELRGSYVSMEGLSREGILGAVSQHLPRLGHGERWELRVPDEEGGAGSSDRSGGAYSGWRQLDDSAREHGAQRRFGG